MIFLLIVGGMALLGLVLWLIMESGNWLHSEFLIDEVLSIVITSTVITAAILQIIVWILT